MEESPDEFVWWEKICSSAASFVMPAFEPLPARKVDKETGDRISRNWSGAVIFADKDYHFKNVRASWTVSRPHPENKAWREQYWESGTFDADTWVGMDGYKERGKGSSDVLHAGISHRCIVSTHQDTEYSTHAWWEWSPGNRWMITGFQVATGDLVSVTIQHEMSVHEIPGDHAIIYFTNFSAGTYTSFGVTAPKNIYLKGNCAEWIVESPLPFPFPPWIVEAHPPSAQPPSAPRPCALPSPMSYLGATFFFDCGAMEKASGVPWQAPPYIYRNLRDATFLEIEQGGHVLSTGSKTFSNDKVLGVVAERRVHFHEVPYACGKE
jgi:hypothetical protein